VIAFRSLEMAVPCMKECIASVHGVDPDYKRAENLNFLLGNQALAFWRRSEASDSKNTFPLPYM
jgi:hypothetical protein